MFGRVIRILMIEDNPGDVRLTREALLSAKTRNELHVVDNGKDAIETLNRAVEEAPNTLPDLILLDWNLPDMHGRDVLRHIKHHSELAKIPVIVLTSSEANNDIADAYKHLANCYVTKPVDADKFFEAVLSIEQFWFTIVKLPTGSDGT